MNMFWNTKLSSEWGSGAVGHMLRAATIATVVSSCSTMQVQPEPDPGDAAISLASIEEEDRPPEIKPVTGEERARFEAFLSKEGYQDVQFLTMAYLKGGQEKLIALKFYQSEAVDPDVPPDQFLIPPVGRNFETAVVTYTGSPAKVTSCGRRRTNAGGTRYCEFQ